MGSTFGLDIALTLVKKLIIHHLLSGTLLHLNSPINRMTMVRKKKVPAFALQSWTLSLVRIYK